MTEIPDGSEVLVTINGQTAKLRTRKLTRSQGPRFMLVRYGSEEHKGEVLLSSVIGKWTGWLPMREIRIHRTRVDGTPVSSSDT